MLSFALGQNRIMDVSEGRDLLRSKDRHNGQRSTKTSGDALQPLVTDATFIGFAEIT